MADIAVFASGRGSNFQALHRDLLSDGRHRVSVLVCDRKAAPAIGYAREQGIDVIYAPYKNRTPVQVETSIIEELKAYSPTLLVLAGYMRLLTHEIISAYSGRIINIHPSLLPRHPGIHSIERSWDSSDEYLGISIHYVDEGMDTGPVIVQQAFHRSEVKDLEAAEKRIHELEHFWYPLTVRKLLGDGPATDSRNR